MKESTKIRSIFISLFVATLAAMLGMGIIEPILPLYAQNMGAGGLMIGLIFAGFALARGVFAPLVGNFSDKHGRKKMMMAGLVFYVFLSLAYTISDTPTLLLIVRFLQGAASVLVTTVAQSYIGDITPPHKEGTYPNIFSISLFAGMALGPMVGGYLADTFSIDAPFYAMALTSIVSLFLIYTLVPEHIRTATARKSASKLFPHALRRALKDHTMRGLMIYSATRGFARWGFNTFFPLFAIMSLSMTKTEIGIYLSAYMLIGAALQYPAGVLADHLEKHRNNIILVSGILASIPLFIIPLVHERILIFSLMVLMGGFSVFARASSIAIRTQRGRVFGMGTTSGVFTTAVSAGQVLGPITFGIMAEVFGLSTIFIIGGAIRVLGSIAAFRYLQHGAKNESQKNIDEYDTKNALV